MIGVWIWQVSPSEDTAKFDIIQVLLTNDKAKDMEGRRTWRKYAPHNDEITIFVTVHNHVARRVLFSKGGSSSVPYNDTMKKSSVMAKNLLVLLS